MKKKKKKENENTFSYKNMNNYKRENWKLIENGAWN